MVNSIKKSIKQSKGHQTSLGKKKLFSLVPKRQDARQKTSNVCGGASIPKVRCYKRSWPFSGCCPPHLCRWEHREQGMRGTI